MGPVVTALLQAVPQIAAIAAGGQPSPAALATIAANGQANGSNDHQSDNSGLKASLAKLGDYLKMGGGAVDSVEFERFVGKDPGLNQAVAYLKGQGVLTEGTWASGFTKDPRQYYNQDGSKPPVTQKMQNEANKAYKQYFGI